MMDELAARRAQKNNDCTLWTPADALAWAQKEVTESSKELEGLMIFWWEKNLEDNTLTPRFAVAGMSRYEIIAKLQMSLQRWLLDSIHK